MYARLSRFAVPPESGSRRRSVSSRRLPARARGFTGLPGDRRGRRLGLGKAAAVTFWGPRGAGRERPCRGPGAEAALDRAEPVREPIVDRYEVVLQREVQAR